MEKNAATGTTNFLLQIGGNVPHLTHKEILSNIGSSCISSLVIDLLTYKECDISHDPSTLLSYYDIIRMGPQSHFTDSHFPY